MNEKGDLDRQLELPFNLDANLPILKIVGLLRCQTPEGVTEVCVDTLLMGGTPAQYGAVLRNCTSNPLRFQIVTTTIFDKSGKPSFASEITYDPELFVGANTIPGNTFFSINQIAELAARIQRLNIV